MQITRAEIIAYLLIHQSLWPFRPRFWILQSGCQPYARTDHNQRPARWSPDIAATVDCLTDITMINHRCKAPRSLICCNATASWLFRREVFQAKLLGGRHPTNGKEAGSVRRLLIWVLGLAWQVCEGDRSNQQIALRSQWRHIHDFCFLTSVISSLTTPAYRGNALRWLLISTIFYSGFFSSEAFDKRTNRVKMM